MHDYRLQKGTWSSWRIKVFFGTPMFLACRKSAGDPCWIQHTLRSTTNNQTLFVLSIRFDAARVRETHDNSTLGSMITAFHMGDDLHQ